MDEQEGLIFDKAVQDFAGDEREIRVDKEKLQAFLTATESIQMLRGERLRQLAIRLESEWFVNEWGEYYQIYEAAIQENPELLDIYTSIAISALGHWSVIADTVEKKRVIREFARKALELAQEIAPEDAFSAYWMGMYYYDSSVKNDKTLQALEWFTRAVALDEQNDFAKLYRAHCFHDLHQWPQAIAAYEAVDPKQILKENSYALWRVLKLKEQIAYCYAQAGQHDQAITRFHKFIDEVMTLDKEALIYDVVDVNDLVEAATKILKDDRLLSRTRKLIKKLEMEKLYQNDL